MENLKSISSRYLERRGGHFALWFALASFPVLVGTSMVIDFRDVEAHRENIKDALDVAVLATVSKDNISDKEKRALAEHVFDTHYTGDTSLELDVVLSDGRVRMIAEGRKDATLSRAVGMGGFEIDESSIAEMTRSNTICVMALAKTGKHKVRFIGASQFDSPTCSVQSNSEHSEGILSSSQHTPKARSFCSTGGAKGDFFPNIRGECRPIEDPYADKAVPESGLCMPSNIFAVGASDLQGGQGSYTGAMQNGHDAGLTIINGLGGWHRHQHCHSPSQLAEVKNRPPCHDVFHPADMHTHLPALDRLDALGVSNSEINRLERDYGADNLMVPESQNYIGNDKIIYPGTYCGGLTVNGQNVTVMPGVYIMKNGPLTFKNGAQVQANEVSFILRGENAVVTVETGSFVEIRAPSSGPMAGMAIYQDKDGNGEINTPTAVNLISSGGELNVTGTLYFPTQALDLLGDSVLGARADATSFIAHQVTFADATKASVSVNHIKGNIPPMLPRSDDGARLIR